MPKHVNPSKKESGKFSGMQYFLLMCTEKSTKRKKLFLALQEAPGFIIFKHTLLLKLNAC